MNVKVFTIWEGIFVCSAYAVHFDRNDAFGRIAGCPLHRHGLASDQLLLGILPGTLATTRPYEWRKFPAHLMPISGEGLELAHKEAHKRWSSLENGDYIEADVLLGKRKRRRPLELVDRGLLAQILKGKVAEEAFQHICATWFIADGLEEDLSEFLEYGVPEDVVIKIRHFVTNC